ncbi:MAG: nucleotidyl transferase AbiEii/AbiGii toxin family protein [Balneola sp.]
MLDTPYRAQVDLLIKILPIIDEEKVFALKGGTAINLFIRDLPRLSVDIDLTYLPFDDRKTALQTITSSLRKIEDRTQRIIPNSAVNEVAQNDGTVAKLTVQTEAAQIKIEVNTVMRGHLFEPERHALSGAVQDAFEQFAEITIVSTAELFGGKICAALDRQHPRDLFDVHYLLQNEGFTDAIKHGFLSALLSHNRPLHEVLSPNLLDQREAFESQFAGMTNAPFTYEDFELTRDRLINEIIKSLTDEDKAFLMSFVEGQPKWDLYPHQKLKELPAIQWKLKNIRKLIEVNPEKNAAQKKVLQEKLNKRS